MTALAVSPHRAASTAPARSCGECSLCCKLLGIAELDKAPGRWCGHFKRGGGCGVYLDRPEVCRSFQCLWLGGARLDDQWRPDRAKFILSTDLEDKRLRVIVDPSSPGAWRREPYYSFIKRMSQRTLDGAQLIVCIGDRRIVVFPHEDVDLGIINPDHKIISGFAERDGQQAPYAVVLSEVEEQPA